MEKTRALIKFREGMERELKEKGEVSFLRGEVAELRRKCLELGAMQGELIAIEDKVANKCVILPIEARNEIWRERRLSNNAMQF